MGVRAAGQVVIAEHGGAQPGAVFHLTKRDVVVIVLVNLVLLNPKRLLQPQVPPHCQLQHQLQHLLTEVPAGLPQPLGRRLPLQLRHLLQTVEIFVCLVFNAQEV